MQAGSSFPTRHVADPDTPCKCSVQSGPSCLNVFEAVGFVADVFDLVDADMPTLE